MLDCCPQKLWPENSRRRGKTCMFLSITGGDGGLLVAIKTIPRSRKLVITRQHDTNRGLSQHRNLR